MKQLVIVVIALCFATVNLGATPSWLEGVPVPWPTSEVKPILPAEIYLVDGSDIPESFVEDKPVHFVVVSDIFADEPPSEFDGVPFHNSTWAGRPLVFWYFTNPDTETRFLASSTESLADNEMIVAPIEPTKNGAIEVFISRRMEYYNENNELTRRFVNSSKGRVAEVKDITPPTCGLQITIGDNTGTVWPIESPVNMYPPPKLADVIFEGSVFCPENSSQHFVVDGIQLGEEMVISPSQGAVYLRAEDELSFMMVLHDNYELDKDSVSFGLSDGAEGEPSVVGTANSGFKVAEVDMPEEPYLFIEAFDTAGNRQLMYIPVVLVE